MDFVGIGIQLAIGAGWQITGVDMDDLTLHDGKIVGANDDGLHVIGEADDDDGTPIAALMETPAADYGTDRLKRLRALLTAYETDGTLNITPIMDDAEGGTYPLPPRKTGQKQHRSRPLPLARSETGHFIQWRIENSAGADFSIDWMKVGLVVMGKGR